MSGAMIGGGSPRFLVPQYEGDAPIDHHARRTRSAGMDEPKVPSTASGQSSNDVRQQLTRFQTSLLRLLQSMRMAQFLQRHPRAKIGDE